MCFRGASLQCSCPSYRADERETLVGPGGGGRGLLVVDWMVEVRPEAEDFDWRTGREAACSRLSCFHIIQFCWDLTADLLSFTKQNL